jgi:phosphate transport system substrate-binding protein
VEYVIGLDGIAVIVNQANPIDHLEKSIIRKIFSGEIRYWQQIDSNMSGPIHVYARDDKSGTYDTFKALVLGKKTPLVKSASRYESNAELSDDVAADASGIGFVGLPYVRRSKALAVAEQGTLPKIPEEFEVATEDYALARRLFMYAPDIHSSEQVKSFIDFCLSAAGQQVVDRTGFISQNLRAQPFELDDGFPEEYLSLTENSQRLSLNFRFRKGTTKLDNKAMRDVHRLVEYLSRDENRHRKVMLFGFAEASETLPVFALDLSTYRVDWVSDLLIQKGIDPVRVRAYGDAIPVASNEDAGGRHKNRRVEVWLE